MATKETASFSGDHKTTIMNESTQIDRSAIPNLPQNFRDNNFFVDTHIGSGIWEYNLDKIGIYVSEKQTENRDSSITGVELYDELKDKPVMDANIMLYLFAHEDTAIVFLQTVYKKYNLKESTCLFFWGTVYDGDHDACVFCMSLFKGKVWYQRAQLSTGFSKNFSALIILE